MKFRPAPKQALLLWRMIAAETPEEREPKISEARPKFRRVSERNELVKRGLVEKERRGRAQHLVLTDRAWAWAAEAGDVRLGRTVDAAAALEGLLHRLVPFLKEREIPLAELFSQEFGEPVVERAPSQGASAIHLNALAPGELEDRIMQIAFELVRGQVIQQVRLSQLRSKLLDVAREMVDEALLRLHAARRIVLVRDDNTSQLTKADRLAALLVGNSPRHVFYPKG